MRVATAEEIENWDALIQANPGGSEALQSKAWGEFKGRNGWQPQYVVFDDLNLAALFLSKSVPGIGTLWYSPKGPGVATGKQLDQVAAQMKRGDTGAFLIKAEPELPLGEEPQHWLKAPDVHISQATSVIDLTQSEDDLSAGFKQKTRYNIKQAGKQGVVVREAGPAAGETYEHAFETLYALIQKTQEHGKFMVRSYDYCADYWQALIDAGQGQVYLAHYQGNPVAGAFVTMMGDKAWYKDGGSDREYSSTQAPYLLQWEIMRDLRAKGIRSYDLVGLPRPGDETSGLAGLVQFKSGFSGEFREFIGTWDLPLIESKYKLWKALGQKLTLAYNTRIKHRLWY